MKLVFEPDYLELLEKIREVCRPDQQLYLVGGAVRDVLLGRPLHDMDFAMGENPTPMARKLAKRLKAGFFVLDDDRKTSRVVYYDPHDKYFPLDFVQYTGENLTEDLRNRDFTMNAMAVPVGELTCLIDPLGGRADLEKGLLRLCSERALLEDPVRVLRGIRLAVQFRLKFDVGLEQALQEAGLFLHKTTRERQRDEFFRLLAGPDPAKGLEVCRCLGIFDTLFPVLETMASTFAFQENSQVLVSQGIRIVEKYHDLLLVLTAGKAEEKKHVDWAIQKALEALGKYAAQLTKYFHDILTSGRSKATLAYFGALLHKLGTVSPQKHGQKQKEHQGDQVLTDAELVYFVAKDFSLSNNEAQWLQTFTLHHHRLVRCIRVCKAPERRNIFRFYRETGAVGVAIALFSLAEALVDYDSENFREQWLCALEVVSALLKAWWEDYDRFISPKLLMDGYDLQIEFGLKPGRLIGDLLTQLEEEQASGSIVNIDQARNFIIQRLVDLSELGGNDEN